MALSNVLPGSGFNGWAATRQHVYDTLQTPLKDVCRWLRRYRSVAATAAQVSAPLAVAYQGGARARTAAHYAQLIAYKHCISAARLRSACGQRFRSPWTLGAELQRCCAAAADRERGHMYLGIAAPSCILRLAILAVVQRVHGPVLFSRPPTSVAASMRSN